VLNLLWHGTLVFPVSSEWPPHLPVVAFYVTQGMRRIYSNPDPHGAKFDLKQLLT
jgi:hypothetical protein